jgi:peptide-methionine (R)-S-oxide reductase
MQANRKMPEAPMTSTARKVTKSSTDWKKELSPEAFHVTREQGTERPWTSPLNNEKRTGMFSCVCCGSALFASGDKFDSGTGWPSFTQPADRGNVAEHDDRSGLMRRTEVRCAACDAHLGHVFPDGPEPTGLRYCINGVALAFEPKAKP